MMSISASCDGKIICCRGRRAWHPCHTVIVTVINATTIHRTDDERRVGTHCKSVPHCTDRTTCRPCVAKVGTVVQWSGSAVLRCHSMTSTCTHQHWVPAGSDGVTLRPSNTIVAAIVDVAWWIRSRQCVLPSGIHRSIQPIRR